MGRVVTGVFRRKERIAKAVEGLIQASVPVDQISVVLRGEDEIERNAAVVAVHADQLAGAAREVFVRAGAHVLTETWAGGSIADDPRWTPAMRMVVR